MTAVDDLTDPTVWSPYVAMRMSVLSAPGKEGLRVSHLQSALATPEGAHKLPTVFR